MGEWKKWSEWLKEGYFVSYARDNVRIYEHILMRDLAHWEYDWPETITTLTDSGPYVPDNLEITRGYDKRTNTNHIWQVIFGIRGQALIYVELPTDLHRHGIPKVPKPSTAARRVSHFDEWMSPFLEPSFVTEHFMIRPENFQIAFSAYNPNAIDLTRVKLNVFIAKCVTERIGDVTMGVQTPTGPRWKECLDKLFRRVIPHKPLTLLPVRAPAEASAGQ